MAAGRLDNGGRIETRAAGAAAVEIAAGDGDTLIENTGVISGNVGIALVDGNAGRHTVENGGMIHGTGGTALRFETAHAGSTLRLSGDSEIVGKVVFGGSDDVLDIFDITSGSLITDGFFDGGTGTDTVAFGDSYKLSDFLDFDFRDATTVAIAALAEDGATLFAEFRNFETFVFAGRSRSFAELSANVTAPVPLPAALPILAAGLALRAGMRRGNGTGAGAGSAARSGR